jgi:type I restriction enzyme S subunit
MSEYPSDWRVLPLGEVAEVVGGGTPSRDVPAFWGNDHYWITPSEVVAKDGQTADRSKEQISDLGLQSSGAKLHPPGTILMTSRASIGFAAITQKEICTNQGFQSLRCGNELDNWFALHQIRHRRAELHQLAAGSTFLEVSGSNVRSFPFILPPLPEQKKIAEILSGIDKEIAGVSQFMQRKRLLRESLLREMIPHPSSFRDGPLPKGWTLTTIEEVCSLITYGFTNPMPTTDRGVYMVTAKDVRDGNIDKTTARFTSVEAYETLLTDKSRPKQNDILVTKDGTLGRTAVVGEETICINQSVALLRPSDQRNAKFLQLLLSSPQYQETMLEESGGSAVKHIYITTLAKMQMATPNSTEATEEVVDCFDALNRSIHLLARKHECLTNLKKALASDLLSGRKRVSI